jgi:peptidoglycan/LPS O-acetylase OafA/YrhL
MLAISAASTGGGRTALPRDVTHSRRVEPTPSLTGMRALAALLVISTHAAFGTGMLSHGYLGLVLARLEIGVQIFFVLSGFLLFRPWVRAAAGASAPPLVSRYAWQRVRRIMPAYVTTVLAVYLIYQFRTVGPNPGHTWWGLIQHLTLTQIYSDQYIFVLHQGLTQTWSLAVEVAFYTALPVLAYLLLAVLCGGRWRPGRLLAGLAALAALTPAWLIVLHGTDWLPSSAGMWLPAHLVYFAGGMALAVLQVQGARCSARVAVPVAGLAYLLVGTAIFGDIGPGPVTIWQPLAKTLLYALIATAAVAPLALGGGDGYSRLLGSRPMVWLGEISYEIFLLHVVVMEIAMTSILRWPVFTGSMPVLVVVTLALTIPPAWLLHRWTRPVPEGGSRKP